MIFLMPFITHQFMMIMWRMVCRSSNMSSGMSMSVVNIMYGYGYGWVAGRIPEPRGSWLWNILRSWKDKRVRGFLQVGG